MNLEIIPVTRGVIDQVVTIHKDNYPRDHITGSLTRKLLIKYYSNFLNDDAQFVVCINKDDSKVYGFLVFGSNMAAKIGQFKQKNIFSLFLFFLMNPKLLIRLISKKILSKLHSKTNYKESEYLILSIATDNESKGVGTALINYMEEYLSSIEISEVGLYVSCSNIRAINFYCSKGFLIIGMSSGQYFMRKVCKGDK